MKPANDKTSRFSGRALGIAAVVLGAGALSGWMALHGASACAARLSPASVERAAAPAGDGASRPGASLLPARQWKLGQSFRYEIDSGRSVGTTAHAAPAAGGGRDGAVSGAVPSLPALPGIVEKLRSRLHGSLSLTVVGRDASGSRLRGELRGARYEQAPAAQERYDASLATPFQITVTPAGEISSFYFKKGVPADVRGQLRALVASLDLVTPEVVPATWHAVGRDMTGEYEASYRVEGRRVHKSKDAYVRARGSKGYGPLPKGARYGVKSGADYEVDDHGWPRSMSEDELLDLEVRGARIVSASRTAATLTAVESHPEWVSPMNDPELEGDAETDEAMFAHARRNADENLVGGRTFTDLQGEVTSPDTHTRGRAQGAMAALFRLDPAAAESAREAVLHGDIDANAKHRTTGALAAAGTREAQAALAAIAGAPDASQATRMDALSSLGSSKSPTEETVQTLMKATSSTDKDLANTAALGLGGAVHTLSGDPSTPVATGDAVQLLIARLEGAASDDDRVICLEALGNTGDARAFAAIQPFLGYGGVAVRAAATGALRFMVGADADQAVIAATRDAQTDVRAAAVSTIPFRPVAGVLAAMVALLKSDPVVAIRVGVVNGFNVQLEADPAVRDALQWAAEHDPSSTVRAAAGQVVAAPQHQEP